MILPPSLQLMNLIHHTYWTLNTTFNISVRKSQFVFCLNSYICLYPACPVLFPSFSLYVWAEPPPSQCVVPYASHWANCSKSHDSLEPWSAVNVNICPCCSVTLLQPWQTFRPTTFTGEDSKLGSVLCCHHKTPLSCIAFESAFLLLRQICVSCSILSRGEKLGFSVELLFTFYSVTKWCCNGLWVYASHLSFSLQISKKDAGIYEVILKDDRGKDSSTLNLTDQGTPSELAAEPDLRSVLDWN